MRLGDLYRALVGQEHIPGGLGAIVNRVNDHVNPIWLITIIIQGRLIRLDPASSTYTSRQIGCHYFDREQVEFIK